MGCPYQLVQETIKLMLPHIRYVGSVVERIDERDFCLENFIVMSQLRRTRTFLVGVRSHAGTMLWRTSKDLRKGSGL